MPTYHVIVEQDQSGHLVSEVIGLPDIKVRSKNCRDLIRKTRSKIIKETKQDEEESVKLFWSYHPC